MGTQVSTQATVPSQSYIIPAVEEEEEMERDDVEAEKESRQEPEPVPATPTGRATRRSTRNSSAVSAAKAAPPSARSTRGSARSSTRSEAKKRGRYANVEEDAVPPLPPAQADLEEEEAAAKEMPPTPPSTRRKGRRGATTEKEIKAAAEQALAPVPEEKEEEEEAPAPAAAPEEGPRSKRGRTEPSTEGRGKEKENESVPEPLPLPEPQQEPVSQPEPDKTVTEETIYGETMAVQDKEEEVAAESDAMDEWQQGDLGGGEAAIQGQEEEEGLPTAEEQQAPPSEPSPAASAPVPAPVVQGGVRLADLVDEDGWLLAPSATQRQQLQAAAKAARVAEGRTEAEWDQPAATTTIDPDMVSAEKLQAAVEAEESRARLAAATSSSSASTGRKTDSALQWSWAKQAGDTRCFRKNYVRLAAPDELVSLRTESDGNATNVLARESDRAHDPEVVPLDMDPCVTDSIDEEADFAGDFAVPSLKISGRGRGW